MYYKVSYEQDFDDLMMHLYAKYGKKLFNLDGIGEQLDINKFSKNFFAVEDGGPVADISVDANANVSQRTGIEYDFEVVKPHRRYNSYYLLWKQLRKNVGHLMANRIIEMQLTGDIYINDFSAVDKPYSYHPDTALVVMTPDGTVITPTMSVLFERACLTGGRLVSHDDYEEVVDLDGWKVWDADGWTGLQRVLRHLSADKHLVRIATDSGSVMHVTDDHPMIHGGGFETLAKEVKVGDYLATCDAPGFGGTGTAFSFADTDWKDAVNLPVDWPGWDEGTRYKLLASVIDNAAYVLHHAGLIDIRVAHLGLAQSLKDLAASLGYAGVRTSAITGGKCGRRAYRMSLRIPSSQDPLFLYSRLASGNHTCLSTPRRRYSYGHTSMVKSVEQTSYEGAVYDITTDTGTFYSNGLLVHNCFNYSTYDIALSGLEGLTARPRVVAPKSFAVFLKQVEQFVVVAANSSLGATGLADMLIVGSHYVRRIFETGNDGHVFVGLHESAIRTYVSEKIIQFIYAMNWQYRGNQSPFTNLSIYDSEFLRKLAPDYQMDGEGADIPTIQWLQEVYIDAMNAELERTVLTFPITTACFCTDDDNNIVDPEFRAMIASKNLRFGFINFYCGKSSTMSSCCFTGSTKVRVMLDGEEVVTDFNALECAEMQGEYIPVWTGFGYADGRLVVLPRNGQDIYKVTLSGGEIIRDTMKCTANHLHPTKRGDVRTDELRRGDVIPVYVDGETREEKVVGIRRLDRDDEKVYCFEMRNQESPYFALANGIVTHNCRLRSNTDNLYLNTSFGAGSTKIGSLGVVTVNLPRAAMKAVRMDEAYADELFIANLRELFDVECRINAAKRDIVSKRIEGGAAPLYTLGHMVLGKQYSTFGIVGLNEAVSILGHDILKDEGQRFVLRILDTINAWIDEAEKKFGAPHNVEQVPAESSSVKLAQKDRFFGYDCGTKLYSNQFIPLTTTADMLDRIRIQGMFDSKFSGGAICHVNVDMRLTDPEKMERLIDYAAKCGVVYWAVNYKLCSCEDGHVWVGGDRCPRCGKDKDAEYSRVVGFYVPVKNFNKTRREVDWPNRQFYGNLPGVE